MLDKRIDQTNFPDVFSVSRETMELLDRYVSLIIKWNRSINLVSKATIDEIWHRHIADSAQVFQSADAKNTETWLDMGAGGGLPGIVITILAKETGSPGRVILLESDARKCAFLRTAVRDLDLSAEIIEDRVENTPKLNADIISARAFTNLTSLLDYSVHHGSKDVRCLFLKGQSHNTELTEARESWNIDAQSIPSLTDSSARVLKIKEISRAQ